MSLLVSRLLSWFRGWGLVGAPAIERVTCTYLVVAADVESVRVRQACEGSRLVRSELCRENGDIAIAGFWVSDVA